MSPNRRGFIRLVGVCSGVAAAGCLDRNGPNGNGSENGRDPEIDTDVSPLAVRTDRPEWDEDSETGYVVIIDSVDRERAVFMSYTHPEDGRAVEAFLDGIDYDRERLVLVESVGPNACYDRLDIDSIQVSEGEIHADAGVVATADEETACAQVITFPSALARITFEDDPLDSITVEITDGWDEQAAVTASTDDSTGPDVDSLDGSVRPDA